MASRMQEQLDRCLSWREAGAKVQLWVLSLAGILGGCQPGPWVQIGLSGAEEDEGEILLSSQATFVFRLP